MKLKHLALLVAALLMTFNMMSLNANAAPVKDKNLAKGFVFAWTAVMLSTGKTTNAGLGKFTVICKANEITKPFYSDKWFADRFNDAMKIFKGQNEGSEGLIKRLPKLMAGFKKLKKEHRIGFVLSLMIMAKYDGSISKREAELIEKITKVANLKKDELLTGWMIWIQQ